jgi:hypothetical protein
VAQRIADGILPPLPAFYNFRCLGEMKFADKGFDLLPARGLDGNYYFVDGSAHLKPFERMNDDRFPQQQEKLFAYRRSHTLSGSGSRNNNTSKHSYSLF